MQTNLRVCRLTNSTVFHDTEELPFTVCSTCSHKKSDHWPQCESVQDASQIGSIF